MRDYQSSKMERLTPLVLIMYLVIPLAFWGAIAIGLIRLVLFALSGD